MAIVAIGKPAPKEVLPPELQQREQPSDRKLLSGIIMEGHSLESRRRQTGRLGN